ncbi:MAG: isochorismatase, partial [Acidimicrobiia bacterium]
MEMQRAVVGDLAAFPDLAEVVTASGVVHATARLLDAARNAGARVVHCTVEFHPDLAGTSFNAPLLAAVRRTGHNLVAGSPGAALVVPLALSDLTVARCHGVSPFTGTTLDRILRNLGVGTIVATGVSLNVGVIGLCIEAVNLGYNVVVATDCVAGVPPSYGQAVLRHALPLLATLATGTEIAACWTSGR